MKILRALLIGLVGTILILIVLSFVPISNHARCVELQAVLDDNDPQATSCEGKQYGWPYAWEQRYGSGGDSDTLYFPQTRILDGAFYFVIITGATLVFQRIKSKKS